jgi:hypothetical protein
LVDVSHFADGGLPFVGLVLAPDGGGGGVIMDGGGGVIMVGGGGGSGISGGGGGAFSTTIKCHTIILYLTLI